MMLTRGTAIAALALAALGVPVTAFALSAAAGSHAASTPAATHAATPAADDDPTEATDPEPSDTGTPNAASEPGRAHAAAMQAWAQCVADAASGPKVEGAPVPPKLACGDKPVAPGRAEHAPAAGVAPGKSADHRPATPHGRGHH